MPKFLRIAKNIFWVICVVVYMMLDLITDEVLELAPRFYTIFRSKTNIVSVLLLEEGMRRRVFKTSAICVCHTSIEQ